SSLDNPRFNFQFQVVDDPTPNAFALPGGYVYVTRGLLTLVVSEDELACVIAHEIIHITKRHSIRQMKKSILPRLLEVPGNLVGRVVDKDLGKLINAPIQTSNLLFQSSYSRKFERESDNLGITLAARAGYNPAAMSPILTRIADAVEILTNQRERKSYFDDHPYTPNRVRSIDRLSQQLPKRPKPPIEPLYPTRLDGMTFGVNPEKGVFRKNLFLHPGLNFSIEFPTDWETTNQSSAVGAVHPDRQAGIFVGLVDPDFAPKVYAESFQEDIAKEYGKIIRSEAVKLNGNESWLISARDDTGKQAMYIHMLWTRLDKLLFQLIGFGPEEFRPQLKQSAESLSSLSKEARASVNRRFVQVIEAKPGETIEQLAKRVPNIVHGKYTAFLNGFDSASTVLKQGQKLKVIRELPIDKSYPQ
ncbi:MAG: M48 family metalloprotease, partial [Acidobacteriota bacterium]|nr:M48 family metalloprotease [Acidobacteriota bacterium]